MVRKKCYSLRTDRLKHGNVFFRWISNQNMAEIRIDGIITGCTAIIQNVHNFFLFFIRKATNENLWKEIQN